MKHPQGGDRWVTSIILIFALAIIAATGCIDSAHSSQGTVTPAGTRQGIDSAIPTTLPAMTATEPPSLNATIPSPTPEKTPASLPATGASDGVIQLDPLGVICVGEKYRITGTTSLPAGTNLVLKLKAG